MAEVIGVKFKEGGKVYYFDPGEITVNADEAVIVETARGMECGIVAAANREVSEDEIVKPLKKVIRLATPKDVAQMEENRRREAHAFEVCQQKILDHKMDMKLVDVEYTFDNSKILFYFTADGRVDFRDLVKDLAGIFRTRIELRQIGVRDEAKMLGGLGICGRPFCCSTFLSDFQPVSIKMAKEQGLSLNPTKISGTCGRLMCCLKYEQNAYDDLIKTTPRVGSQVITPEGRGTVEEIVNILTGSLKIRIENGDNFTIKNFSRDEVTSVGGFRQRDNRQSEQPKPREEIKEEVEPELLELEEIVEEEAAIAEQQPAAEKPKKNDFRPRGPRNSNRRGHRRFNPNHRPKQDKPANAE